MSKALTNRNKYVNALFIGLAAIVWLIASHYVGQIIGRFQLARKFSNPFVVDALRYGIPVIIALAAFIAIRSYDRFRNFATDAVSELSQVIWPGVKEVRVGTIVVVITVIISGLFLTGVDKLFGKIVEIIIKM